MFRKIIKELRTDKATPEEFISISLETVEISDLIPPDAWIRIAELSLADEQNRGALSQVNLLLIAALNKHNPGAAAKSVVAKKAASRNLRMLLSLLSMLDSCSDPRMTMTSLLTQEPISTIRRPDVIQLGVFLPETQRRRLYTIVSNSISSAKKDISNNTSIGRDIFSKDLCADCQARLLRKYPKKSVRIPARMKRQKEFDYCLAYIVGAWHGLFRSVESFCKYSSRVGEEYKDALKAKGIRVDYIDHSAIRKILERNLEKSEMKFLEKRMR